MKALLKLSATALLASFLAACSLIPPAQQSNQRPVQAQVQTAADTSSKPPEKTTFPNMVATTPLVQNLPADKNAQLNAVLEQALAEKPAEEGFRIQGLNLPQVFIVRFMAQAKNLKEQVKIPENGEFKLVLEAGTGKKLEILDGDGSDGQATIRLPKQTYETLLHLQGPWKPNSSLEVSDGLYYVKDNLSSKQGKLLDLNRWFLLGVRPLPVPSDWYNPDGQKLVLKFKTDTVKEFQMAWWTTNDKVPFPPGIKQIGPQGGVVELPGVAKLELPAGALNQNTTLSIKQMLSAPAIDTSCPKNKVICDALNYVAPVIQIQPMGLRLNQPGHLSLPSNMERVGVQQPGFVSYMYSETLDTNAWETDEYLLVFFPDIRPPSMTGVEWRSVHNRPIGIRFLGYFSKYIYDFLLPDGSEKIPTRHPFQISAFQIKQTPPTPYQEASLDIPFGNVTFEVTFAPNIKAPFLRRWLEDLLAEYSKANGMNLSLDNNSELRPRIKIQVKREEIENRFNWGSLKVIPISNLMGKVSKEPLRPSIELIQFSACPFSTTFPCEMNEDYVAETVAHEMFHAFQKTSQEHFFTDNWFIESSAEVMGAYMASTFAQSWGFTYKPKNRGQSASQNLIPRYQYRIEESQRAYDDSNNREMDGGPHNALHWRLYTRRPTVYTANAFLTHIVNKRSDRILALAKMNQEFGTLFYNTQSLLSSNIYEPTPIAAIQKTIGNIDDLYIDYVKDAYIKENISLFPREKLPDISGYSRFEMFVEANEFVGDASLLCTEMSRPDIFQDDKCIFPPSMNPLSVRFGKIYPDLAYAPNESNGAYEKQFPNKKFDVFVKLRKDLLKSELYLNKKLMDSLKNLKNAQGSQITAQEIENYIKVYILKTKEVDDPNGGKKLVYEDGFPRLLNEEGEWFTDFRRDEKIDSDRYVFAVLSTLPFAIPHETDYTVFKFDSDLKKLNIHVPLEVYMRPYLEIKEARKATPDDEETFELKKEDYRKFIILKVIGLSSESVNDPESIKIKKQNIEVHFEAREAGTANIKVKAFSMNKPDEQTWEREIAVEHPGPNVKPGGWVKLVYGSAESAKKAGAIPCLTATFSDSYSTASTLRSVSQNSPCKSH